MLTPALALVLALQASVPAPAPAGTCRTLSAARIGDAAAAFVGEREARLREDGVAAVAAGCGGGEPQLVASVVGGGGGEWEVRALPRLGGLPFDHREQTWLLGLAEPVDGKLLWLRLAPIATEFSADASRIARADDGTRHAVAALGTYDFVVVEQGQGPHFLLRRFTSNGPHREVETVDAVPLSPAWPETAELAGVDGVPGDEVVFGRTESEILGSRIPGGALPRLPVPPRGAAAGLWCGGGPSAFVAAGGTLELFRVEDGAWRAHASTPFPDVEALAAACDGEARDRPVAFGLAGERVEVRTHDGLSWGSWTLDLQGLRAPGVVERPSAAERVAAGTGDLGDDERRVPGPLLLGGVALLGLAALGVLVARRLSADRAER